MDTLRPRSAQVVRAHHPQGMIAVKEVISIIAIVLALIWGISQILSFATQVPTSPVGGRYRAAHICLDLAGRSLTVFRPLEGVFRYDLETAESDRILPFVPVAHSRISGSRDRSTMLVCTPDGLVTIFRHGEEVELDRVDIPGDLVETLVSDQGQIVICVAADHRVYGWRWTGMDWISFEYGLTPGSEILVAYLNPDGLRLCVALANGKISFYDAVTGKPEFVLNAGADVATIAWSDDERLIAAFTFKSEIRIFDAAAGRLVCEGSLAPDSEYCDLARLLITPDNRRIVVSTNRSNEIYVWEVASATRIGRLTGHQETIRSMQLSPDSDHLYSSSFDGTIREWSLQTFSQTRVVD